MNTYTDINLTQLNPSKPGDPLLEKKKQKIQ